MLRFQRCVWLLGASACTLVGETSGWVCDSDEDCPPLYRCSPEAGGTIRVCEASPRPVAAPITAPDAGASRDAGTGPVDAGTSGPRFRADVQPIFDQHCVSCHGLTPIGNTLNLTANASYAALVGADSVCAPGTMSVAPSDLQGSMLWRKLGGSLMFCGQPMPPQGSLKSTQPAAFATIEAWIRQGARND